MGKIRYKLTFPCGAEIEKEIISIPLIDNFDYVDDDIRECPIHGKNCRRAK